MRTALPALLYVALAALGTYQLFRPTIDSGFAVAQSERGDGMLNHYILENSWRAVTAPAYRGALATPPFCFPERGTVYYSENLFGAAPLYWALRPVLPSDLAYMGWQIGLSLLNFAAFAAVARRFGLAHLLTACGAYLWAFAMVHADQLKHQQMIGRCWMPVALYYTSVLVTVPSPRALNRAAGAVFLQCLTCFYTGWFLVVALAVFAPTLVALRPGAAGALRRLVTGRPWAVGRIVAAWGLATGALFLPYVLVNHSSGHTYEACFGNLPTPAAWVTGPPGARWEQTLEGYSKPTYYECKLFAGFGILVLMLAAACTLPVVRRGARPDLWAVAAAGLVTAAVWWVLTVSAAPDGGSLWWFVRHIPGGKAVRVVGRVYVVVYLFGTLGGLVWLQLVTERVRRGWVRAAIRVAVAAVLVWEQTGVHLLAFHRSDFYPIVDRTAADLRGAEAGYVVPRYRDGGGGGGSGPYGDVFGMWVGLRANVPVVNAYSGVLPPDFPQPGPLTDEQIRTWLKGRFRGTVRVVDSETPGRYREIVVE